MLLSWLDARAPSRAVFRGLLPWRIALLSLNAAVLAAAVLALARIPEGAAGADAVGAVALALGAPLLADVLAMGFLRDFAVPRVVLRRLRFGAAVRESLAALGAWYVRYLLMLGLLAAAVWLVLANLLALLFGPSFANGSAPLLFLFAALATPWQLLRCLWSLDLLFRIDPAARALVPPRAFAAPAKRPRPPSGPAAPPGDRAP